MRSVVAILLGIMGILTSLGVIVVAQELPDFIPAPVDLEAVIKQLCSAALDEASYVRQAAIQAMVEIDPAGELALPLLLEVLKSDEADEIKLIRAVKAIKAYSQVAAFAIPTLVKLKSRDSYWLHGAIADALDAIGAPRVEDLPKLIKLLNNTDSSVRSTAARIIGKLGEQAVDAIPALIERLEDKNADVRAAAAQALGAIGPAANQAVPKLIQLMSDKVNYVWEAASRALDSIGAPRLEDIETIKGYLAASNPPSVVGAAAEALGKLGAQAKQMVPELIVALDAAPRSAAWALGEILRDAPVPPDEVTQQAVTGLLPLLDHDDKYVRAAAAEALGKIGSIASPALPSLIALLGDDTWISRNGSHYVRDVARNALQRVGEPRPEQVGELTELLKPEYDYRVRVAATRALGQLGPNAKAAVPRLIECLSNLNVSHEARAALEAIGPLSPEDLGTVDVDKLVDLLSHENSEVKSEAARALGELRYGEAIDELASLLTDESATVKATVAWALGEILQGTTNPPADVVRGLISLVEDPNDGVVIAALEAIAKIYASDEVCSEELFRSLYQCKASTNEQIRRAAGRAWVAASSCWLPEKISVYVDRLEDIDPGIRKAGAEMLGWIGPAASSAICPLMEALARETVKEVSEVIVRALAAIGAPPLDCISDLLAFLEHERPLVRRVAAEVLGRLAPDLVTSEIVAKLLERVAEDVDPSVRAAAATALGRLLGEKE